MVTIKLKAADVRRLQKLAETGTENELRNFLRFLDDLQKQQQEKNAAAKLEKQNAGSKFTPQDCVALIKQEIPEATMPPFPPPEFFYRIGVAIRSWGMTPDYIKQLCEKAKRLNPPYQISWIMANHERIMADAAWGSASGSTWRAPLRPRNNGNGNGNSKPWHGGGFEPKVE